MKTADFQKLIWHNYRKAGRSFPWRETTDPYRILVSEIMLQQTQTDRVVPKYRSWLKKFSTVKKLASASTADVLKEWKGLGYNRRALNLKRAAEVVTKKYNGKLPQTLVELDSLPGIGPYTAGAIMTFAFNEPAVFIETNIRTVFIHFFFKNSKEIHDKDILSLIAKTLDTKNPREWYYALMDYGAMLKKSGLRNNVKSKHYTKQSPFKGSNREVRSKILTYTLEHSTTKLSPTKLAALLSLPLKTVQKNLTTLKKEGFF